MRASCKIPLVVLAAFCVSVNASASDFQYWNTNAAEWRIKNHWRLSAEQELRFTDKASRLSYEHTDLNLTYSGMAEWFDLGAGYRHIYQKDKDKWKYECRPGLSGTFKMRLLGLDISNRNKLEYRLREGKDDNWRYRNRTMVKFPVKIDRFEFKPYVADEIYLDLSDRAGMKRNRIYSGIEFKILEPLVLDVYYLLESDKGRKKWIDTNVLGTKLKFIF